MLGFNLKDTTRLIHLRFLFLKNETVRPTPNKLVRWSILLTLGILFLVGDYVFFYRIIKHIDGLPLNIGEELIFQLMGVIFLTLFAMVLFSSVVSSLSIFFISADSSFLHSLPISLSSIINVRVIQTVVNSTLMVMIFSFPIFCAYGNYFGVSTSYYVFLTMCLLPFVTIPVLLGILGIMLLMRFFPTDRAYQVLSFLGLFFLVGLVMFFRFLSPEKFFSKNVSDEMIIAFVESLRVPEFDFLPTSWISYGLERWVNGDYYAGYLNMGYLYGALLIGWMVFKMISNSIYFPGWRNYQEVHNAPKIYKKPINQKKYDSWFSGSKIKGALLHKDLKILSRDPSQWSQFLILIALVAVYLFNIMNLPLENLVLKNVVSVLNIGLIGFVLSALSVRFVFSAVSIEGKKLWIIYTAPVNMRVFLMSKFWMYWPPLLLIGEILVIASNYLLQVDAFVMKSSVIGVFLMTTGLVGMAVGMGAMYPRFDYQNISEISTGTGGILYMLTSLIFVGLILILGARPIYVHLKEKFLLESVGGFDVTLMYSLIIILSLFVTMEPLRRGIKVLRNKDI